jgi:membrane protease YdiL (CAAX protease family)
LAHWNKDTYKENMMKTLTATIRRFSFSNRSRQGAERMTMNTKGIVSFLVLTFGISWTIALVLFQFGVAPGDTRLAAPFGFAPALAAIVVRKWITREGFADAGLRPNLRETWPYYLVAWLLPLIVVPTIVALVVLFGLSQPDFTYQRAFTALNLGIPPALFAVLPPPFPLLLIPLVGTFIIWGEEFGWRGYLQIRLFADRPVRAAVATGVIWGLWHAPLILAGLNFPDNRVLGVFLFPVTTTLWSIIFGWLRQRTGSSWSASLAHAATNSVGGTWLALLFYGGPNWTFVSYGSVIAWIPLSLICTWIVLRGYRAPAAIYQKRPVHASSAG